MSNTYFPLSNKTHFSILRALSRPDKLAQNLVEKELDGGAVTDYGLSSAIEWFKACKKEKKKCILGTTLQILENDNLYDIVLLSKNYKGWKSLIKIVSGANSEGFIKNPKNQVLTDGYPSLTFDQLIDYDVNDLVAVMGGVNSRLSLDFDQISLYKELFPNFYLGLDFNGTEQGRILVEKTRGVAAKLKASTAALSSSYYLNSYDAPDHRILLYNLLGATTSSIKRKLENPENSSLTPHFLSSSQYLKTYQEMLQLYSEEELDRTLEISSLCEEYNILSDPILPQFECPNNLSPLEYMKELCRKGWREKIQGKIPKEKEQEYVDRVKHEFEIIEEAGLSSYFLTVWDIVEFARKSGYMTSIGRGSAAGSLVSFVLNITQVDPIKYNLIFSRFFNRGRVQPGRVVMPDIDLDFPIEKRETVVEYIRNKYGNSKVGQLSTYQTIKGRGAIKAVLRCSGNISFDEMNRITEHMEDEAKIMGDLQEMKEESEDGEASIIEWALINKPEKFKEWVEIKDGKLEGPLGEQFAQAIRLEGTKSSRGHHPAGIVISPENLGETCPMVWDSKSKTNIIGYDLKSCESGGLTKIDILGIACMSKMMKIKELLKQ